MNTQLTLDQSYIRAGKLRRATGRFAACSASILPLAAIAWLGASLPTSAAEPPTLGLVRQDAARKTVMLADGQGHLALRLNYDGRCVLDQIVVRGREVAAESGVSSGVRVGGRWYTTQANIPTPTVVVRANTLTVSGIVFGKPGSEIRETWRFTVSADRIVWRIARQYPSAATLDDTAFPEWDFRSLSTWTGGMLGDGGVVWDKYLDTPNATYGAHTGAVTFWNAAANDCLRITTAMADDHQPAVRFSHQPADASRQEALIFDESVSGEERKPKHDLRRFLSDRQDLWAPFAVKPRTVDVAFTLQALDYRKAYNRGTFRGVDGANIGEMLNTVGRYGVIDRNLVGGNGWRSGYMCLHEQWFAQIGLAVGDPDYTGNLAESLDYERDHAIGPDGRVLSRWKYDAGDAMAGTYNPQGFYEAQWGYLMDSQADYVMTVAEEYDLNGDTKWLAGQKSACEQALGYLMRREVAGTGLVSVLTDSRSQGRGSDWFDIVWASYENALINAELYHALNLWADAEDSLGDAKKAAAYRAFAARLKTSFNRPIVDGGFWDPANKRYVYWREKDNSVHGDNLFTAVNFAAIGYGLCDEPARQKAILDSIETATTKERLFTWPVNFTTFAPDEAAGSNFPFPSYENGDLFLSWGELGVRAYAGYDPKIALKYIKQTLARYKTDGLSFQRYLRKSQAGAGDDILAGNCMAVVGLYRDIYGIQPKPDRLYLAPHLPAELEGTQIRYHLRGQQYVIDLSSKVSTVSVEGSRLLAATPFGVSADNGVLRYFPGASKQSRLSIARPGARQMTIQVESWADKAKGTCRWTEAVSGGSGKTVHTISLLHPAAHYWLSVNGKRTVTLRTDHAGYLSFASAPGKAARVTFELRPVPRQESTAD